MFRRENCWLAGASLPWLAWAISSFSLACASRQSLVSSDCRNRSPSTKKCVCHVLPRFTSDIFPAPSHGWFSVNLRLFRTLLRTILVPPSSSVFPLLLRLAYLRIADRLVTPLGYEIGGRTIGICT